MAASPRSTVSSDLYCSSEPAQPRVDAQGGSFRGDANHHPFHDPHDDAEESGNSDTMQGLDSAGEDASRPSSAAAGSTTNGVSPETTHKRKRDQDPESGQVTEDHTSCGDYFEEKSMPGRISSYRSMDRSSSQWQHRGAQNDLSGVKRSKIHGPSPTSVQDTKVPCKVSTLPAALWQYILCFVPPVFLGHLLFVNHAFKSYLTPGEEIPQPATPARSIVQPLTAEAIWVASRRHFAPGLPRPIHGLRELDMWRLLVGKKCQRCGHVGNMVSAYSLEKPWESGPGASGVRVVWPFGMRCCGPCLQHYSMKEMDFYLSAGCPSFLLQAVPFACVSTDNHYVGHNILRKQSSPPSIGLTKHFHKPTIEKLMHQFEDVKLLGPASIEEWIKGLARQGQERLEDIIRWEQWESKGGLKKVNARPHPKTIPAGTVTIGRKGNFTKEDSHSDRSTPLSTVASTKDCQASQGGPLLMESAEIPPIIDMTPAQPAWSVPAHIAIDIPERRRTPISLPRPERSIRDVNAAKATRRAEIERRCAALDPPLLPSVLNHMESFQAAMQITQPMTAQAWQILQPRLLAQLPYAERKEKERVQQKKLLEEEYRQRRLQEAQLKETKESFDREWENFQNPVRIRLGAMADDVIESRWAGGRSVTKDISPKFAADVLLSVRQRFYAEISGEIEAAVAAGENVMTSPPNGPPTRTLILENMKWLFDTKIKPLTDHFQRELFLCNGCDGNFKFYGFEGVIQHYAAKHTTTLSMGNIVVHWRAEWPECPPFNPNPSVAISAYYKIPTPANSIQGPIARDIQGPTLCGGISQSGETDLLTVSQRQESLQRSTDTYTTRYTGQPQDGRPILPGQPYLSQSTYGVGAGYPGAPNGYASSAANYNPHTATQQPQIQQPFSSSYSNQQPYSVFAQEQPAPNPLRYLPGLNNENYGSGQPIPFQASFPNGILPAHAPNVPGHVSDLYQRQMDDMAKHAKDVFTSIGGVKDLPGSVRIYVVIQLTVTRFKANFPNEPSLSMFIDGLDHNPTMRPVRSVNGLGCKTCMRSGTGAKLFTLPHLVNHFRTVHVESPQILGHPQAPDLDWKVDMIDLPDASIISKLVNAVGMTDTKLALMASVFHGLFPSPLPNSRSRPNSGSIATLKKEATLNLIGASRVPTKVMTDAPTQSLNPPNDQPHDRPYSGFQSLSRGLSSEPLEPPGEDEYDPHRPALLGTIGEPGAISSPSHKLVRPSTLQNGHGSSLQVQYEPSCHPLSRRMDDEQTLANGNSTPSNGGGRYPGAIHAQDQDATHPPSPRNNLAPQPRGRLDIGAEGQSMTQHRNQFNSRHTSMEYNTRYHRTLDHGSLDANPGSSERVARNASPQRVADVADRFLTSLAPNADAGHSGESHPLNRETEPCSQVPWEQAGPPLKRRLQYFGHDGAYDQWSSDESSVENRRAGPSEVRSSSQVDALRKTGSGTRYMEDHRPSSHVQIPLKSLRADESPNTRYDSHPSVIQERHEMMGSAPKRARSGSHTYPGTHMSQLRPASVSSNEAPADTALYRPRSPVEEDRGDSMYLARSPSALRHDRPQRIVSYEYPPQARYEYIDDHGLREPQYQQRVEYVRVPFDYEGPRLREPPARYFVSRPVEQVESEYVRYEQSYTGDPVFERNGQIYHAPQRGHQAQPSRAAPSFAPSYKY